MKKIILILLSLIVIGFASVAVFINSNKTTKNEGEIHFTIEKGASLNIISNQLKARGVINSTAYFKYYAKSSGYDRKIKAGNYIIKPNISLLELMKKFQNPASDYNVITIPEGYTFYQIASKLAEAKLADKDKFLRLKLVDVTNSELVKPIEGAYYELEGYLYPETYYLPKNADEKAIAKIMYTQFEKIFNEEYRQRAKELKLSIEEVITIASLIEREAANDSERKTIAGVINNRREIGMLLQIDASVIYAITHGEKTLEKVYNKDLEFKSPYNTYYTKGIPIGPIANPGKPSIEAALYPEENDYLYYVLGDSGHVFSETYSEHLKNIKKYLH